MSKTGRPMKFKSNKELQQKIDQYFQECDRNGRPYTITGLALALETTRQTLLDYEKKYTEFSDTVKRAKLRIENYAEEQLFVNKNTAGIIFNMVNNFGWKNKHDIDNNIANKDGKPFEINQNVDLRKLDPQDLEQLEQILSKVESEEDYEW